VAEEPTAVHEPPAVHDTPDSVSPMAPVGLGVAWTLQEVPSHTSASVSVSLDELVSEPTAVQAPEAVHDTPDRELYVAPARVAVVWILQDVPSHASAKAAATPEGVTE